MDWRWSLAAAGCITLLCCPAGAQEQAPRFKDYAVERIYGGKVARVDLSTPGTREYRTRLREAAKEKVNFAGRYIVVKWGCGTSCVTGAIIDAMSGKVTMLPFTICCWKEIYDDFDPFAHRPNSRLIVFMGEHQEDEKPGYHYYVLDKGKLRFLKTVATSGDFTKAPQ